MINFEENARDAQTLWDMQMYVRQVTTEKGWRNTTNSFAEYVALLHSEASEALEAWRDHHDAKPHYEPKQLGPNKPVGVDSELADVFIRLLDMCDIFEVDLYKAFLEKMAYNQTRSYQHGGRTLDGGV